MNIVEKIPYPYGLVYYGSSDLASSYDVKFLIENFSVIDQYFRTKSKSILFGIDDYIDYLWLIKFSQFDDIIPQILKEEIRSKFSDCLLVIRECLKSFKIGSVIQYLNDHISDVFNYSHDNVIYFDMLSITIDFVYSHSSSFEESIFQMIEDDYWHIVVDNFSKFKQYYINHIDRFSAHILNEKIAVANIKNFNRVFNLLEDLYQNKPFKDILTKSAKAVCSEILHISEGINAENYLETLDLIEKGKKIAKKYKFKEAYQYELLDEKNKPIRDAFFEKYGHKFEYGPIDLKKTIIHLKESKKQDFVKFLGFSHIYDKETERLISTFDSVMTKQYSLTDFIKNIGEESNDYFTPSRLSTISFQLDFYWHLLYLCICDDQLFDDLFSYFHSTLYKLLMDGVLTQVDIDEFTGLTSLIKSLIELDEEKAVLKHSIAYSTCLSLCAYIELILSKLFDKLNSEESYIDKSFLTLGSYLEKSEVMDYLGTHHAKILEYQLCRVSGTNIGLNIRNRLMHHFEIDFESMGIGKVVQVLYIFTSLINAIAVHYIDLPPRDKGK